MSDDIHKYPSQTAERFQIRMPDGLRDRIRLAADANNRSMNAEIVAALEEKFPAPEDEDVQFMISALARMTPEQRKRFTEAVQELAKDDGL